MKDQLLKHAAKVGLFLIVLFIACLLWRFALTDPAVINFHMLSLKTLFPGFTGYTAGSIIWGGMMAFVYGFIGSLIFHSLHKGCCKNGGQV